MKNIIKNTFIFLVTFVGLLTVALIFLSVLYQDKIIKIFISEINKNLKAKIVVGHIDLSFLKDFPNASLQFKNIKIDGTLPSDSLPIADIQTLYLSFDIYDIIDRNYRIKKVSLENAKLNARIDVLGNVNFDILRKSKSNETDNSSQNQMFHLDAIFLKNVSVKYFNDQTLQEYDLMIHKMNAGFHFASLIKVNVKGNLDLNSIKVNNHRYVSYKPLKISSELEFDKKTAVLTIKPSEINLSTASSLGASTNSNQSSANFELKGFINTSKKANMDLSIDGKKSDIGLLISLAPENISRKLSVFKSTGNIYFHTRIHGKLYSHYSPRITLDFGTEGVSLIHPDIKTRIENLDMLGHFDNGGSTGIAEVKLQEIACLVAGKKCKGDFYLKNFSNPYIRSKFNANVDLDYITKLFPIQNIDNVKGTSSINIDFDGNVSDIKLNNFSKLKTNGSLDLIDISFNVRNKHYAVNKLNSSLTFNNNDLLINHFEANFGKSDISISGAFKNLVSFIFLPNKKLTVNASLKSKLIDLEELLTLKSINENEVPLVDLKSDTSKVSFSIPNYITFVIDASVDKLNYKRFHPEMIKGNLSLTENEILSNGLSMNLAGGNLKLDGKINALSKSQITLETNLALNKIYIDSVLYITENLGQKFITDNNLKGQLTTNVSLNTVINQQLQIDPSYLIAKIKIDLNKGELINFEPMQKLSTFLDANELSNVRFEQLVNTFYIENEKIYIPEMEIKSNLNTISISGVHKFSGEMDYKVRLSLKNYKKKDSDSKFGIVKDQRTGNTEVFVTVKGTADNLKIAYDKQAVKNKIINNWKEEKKEFKNIFKKSKPKITKKVQIDSENTIE